MTAYYNEIDKYAAQWLRNLIDAGHIAKGVVDERSIEDVRPSDLIGFKQCHFFAGIGGWSVALRLAGWPDDKPVWTGSCPCQPYSQAGKGAGFTDKRHLWPAWFHLITQRKPPAIVGEQVEAAIKHGWLDLVQDDLEGSGYAFAATALPAASVGAPHIRQRAWFVAQSDMYERCAARSGSNGEEKIAEVILRQDELVSRKSCGAGSLPTCHMGDPNKQRPQRREVSRESSDQLPAGSAGVADDWSAEWVYCRDEKYRPVEPGTFPLANGVQNRVGRLRAYGNAIVPQVAEQIIRAFYDVSY